MPLRQPDAASLILQPALCTEIAIAPMKSTRTASKDPCLPIQADLSAMLDGELDAASVRRVLVHSDVCQSCHTFLKSIRNQIKAHQELMQTGLMGATSQGAVSEQARDLRRRLLENQVQLARILYELGRGFVLMTASPNYSRVVAREPVPVPDMALRGRNLLDEVERLSETENMHVGEEWVRAKVLFDADPNYMKDNLAKGKRLLGEALALRPDYHEARIYMGQAHQMEGDLRRAKKEYARILSESREPKMRAFALENLGNVYLELDQQERALPYFLKLVESGIVKQEPRFFTSYFNLALAYAFISDFAKCEKWLARLHDEFPSKRRMVARELTTRDRFTGILRQNADVHRSLAGRFPCWFPNDSEGS
jgi:tetratricopeptide (TPR) repeat protein